MSFLIVSFEGIDAQKGHLDAFSGIESMAGLARALTLIAHFAATGEVRHRFPFSSDLRFYLEDTEKGSFNWKLKLAAAATLASPLAINVGSSAIYDLAKMVLARSIGQEPAGIDRDVESLDRSRGGDINALIEAIEPALKKAHYGVGETATSITIREESSKEIVVKFDSESKEYLLQDVPGDDDVQQVSISALNANDRTGRAYFLDLHRTIPFRVSREARDDTMAVLSASLDAYVNKDPAPVQISFERIETSDGRLKRIVIYGAVDVSGTE